MNSLLPLLNAQGLLDNKDGIMCQLMSNVQLLAGLCDTYVVENFDMRGELEAIRAQVQAAMAEQQQQRPQALDGGDRSQPTSSQGSAPQQASPVAGSRTSSRATSRPSGEEEVPPPVRSRSPTISPRVRRPAAAAGRLAVNRRPGERPPGAQQQAAGTPGADLPSPASPARSGTPTPNAPRGAVRETGGGAAGGGGTAQPHSRELMSLQNAARLAAEDLRRSLGQAAGEADSSDGAPDALCMSTEDASDLAQHVRRSLNSASLMSLVAMRASSPTSPLSPGAKAIKADDGDSSNPPASEQPPVAADDAAATGRAGGSTSDIAESQVHQPPAAEVPVPSAGPTSQGAPLPGPQSPAAGRSAALSTASAAQSNTKEDRERCGPSAGAPFVAAAPAASQLTEKPPPVEDTAAAATSGRATASHTAPPPATPQASVAQGSTAAHSALLPTRSPAQLPDLTTLSKEGVAQLAAAVQRDLADLSTQLESRHVGMERLQRAIQVSSD